MDNKIDETLCPLCREENGCMAHSDESCWCNDVTVPQELIDLVPEAQQRKACICRFCIEKFNANRVAFTAKIRNESGDVASLRKIDITQVQS